MPQVPDNGGSGILVIGITGGYVRMGYLLTPKLRELLEAEVARDVETGRESLPAPIRVLLHEADAAVLQRAATAQGFEAHLHSLYLRAICLQAIAQKNPLVEITPYAKGALGTYRDAHQLLCELRAGTPPGFTAQTSVKIAVSIHDAAN